ncbi:N-formylglutamate amidohydrolase [Rhodobacteraceae bacterium RKSG542]|uniref:N-formylglutamate amidohydrolase n=1 Tax=Pseudovibrio flavus TaxID=2529854 RepID=UPI0012BCB8BF|nr:N-formylglutamate amidohydrolase [Pseudovibrio flavus]MTI16536.1 N-formylglutamate amidohydrolase [Pseudovibrio flavus]
MKIVEEYNSHPSHAEQCEPFELTAPSYWRVPFVFNSPHSGRHYLKSFVEASRLDHHQIRRSEDAFLDLLYADVPSLGAPLLSANFPRVYLDVNREPYELDPKMFVGRLPSYVNSRSLRVGYGLGTIAKVVSEKREVYRHRIPVEEGLERIDTLYKPYHAVLLGQLSACRKKFGHAILVDCHSMPSCSQAKVTGKKADIILGDRYGSSCAPELTYAAYEILSDLGFHVVKNKPYAGGFITEHYGRPAKNIHALQIEVNRALYMDEENHRLHDGHLDVKKRLFRFANEFMHYGLTDFGSLAAAAE